MARRVQPRSRWRRHRRNRWIAGLTLMLLGVASLLPELRAQEASPMVAVALLARDVRSGAVLEAGDVTTLDIPTDSPLQRVALAPQQVIGRTAVGDLLAGEMLTGSRIIDQASRPGYATMPVSFTDPGQTPFLAPGMRIDIVWTPDDLSGRAPEVVAQDARVLRVGAGSELSAGPGAGLPVLLEVAESDAVRLAGATGSGSLSVLMR